MNFNNLLAQIFKDKRNQTIYYRPTNKTAYLVPQAEERKVNAFHHRMLLSIAVGAAFYSFFANQLIGAIAISVVLYLAFTYWFFKKILPRLTTFPNYNLEANLPAQPDKDPRRILLVGIAYMVLSVLLIVSLFIYDNTNTERALYIVFALFGLGLGFHNLSTYLLFKRKK
ncbi:MAG: hypothetical protein GX775_01445 [Erysipelothrix sp.]|jgi:hypothetical protein|nr:hypothetical protein [Erysipelothrix sp.]